MGGLEQSEGSARVFGGHRVLGGGTGAVFRDTVRVFRDTVRVFGDKGSLRGTQQGSLGTGVCGDTLGFFSIRGSGKSLGTQQK